GLRDPGAGSIARRPRHGRHPRRRRADQGGGNGPPRGAHGRTGRAAGTPLRRRYPRGAAGAPGHGHQRQGRHDPPRPRRRQPARLPRRRLQGPDGDRARARFPLARPQGGARARDPRRLQPLPLRGRPRRPRPGSRARADLARPLRPHQRLRGAAGRQRHPGRQVLPPHLGGRAAGAPARPGAGRDQGLEALRRRLGGADALGRLHGRLRRRPRPLRHRSRPMARGARRPQVVPQPGRRRGAGRSAPPLPRRLAGRPRRPRQGGARRPPRLPGPRRDRSL
ncbi:MAG: Polyphosphate kinase 2, partial [uncultured Thermomicrobiales bacterium]